MTSEYQLLKALQRFEPRIEIDAADVDADFIEKVIAKDVKLAFYLAGMSATVVHSDVPKIALDVRYKNTEVSPTDIYVVSSREEVHSVLCQHIGNYRTRLILFAKPGIDVVAEYRKFVEVNSTYYSNFVGAEAYSGKLSLVSMTVYDFSLDYRIGRVMLATMENETNAEVARLAAQMFLPGMSDATKAFLAHNYLAHSIEYTLRENISDLQKSYMQSAYGGLIKKKCVCQGYAEAFKRLMDYAGIPCEVICGQIKGSTTYHAWNLLSLNDGRDHYHVDVTWDSADEKVSYDYFGLKDADLIGKRTWNREYTPPCNASRKLLTEARIGLMAFRSKLIANGVSMKILGY